MGILGFQPWLRLRFGANAKSRKSRYFYDFEEFRSTNDRKKVRRLFIDFNSMIHEAISEVYDILDEEGRETIRENPDELWHGDTGVFATIVSNIHKLVRLIKPTLLLYIAADGVVSKAKMQQQRERTYASSLSDSALFDRTQIKPGTEFMNSLSAYVKKRLPEMWKQNISEWPMRVEFSDASIRGEGEHKIMERMTAETGFSRESERRFDVIYSPDSDMALLAMMHTQIKEQTIVMRQKADYSYEEGDEDVRWEYYDSSGIRSDLAENYGISHIPDFIFLTIFAGNDFLPGLPCTQGSRSDVFDSLVSTYQRAFADSLRQPNLIKSNSEIEWDGVLKYLEAFQDPQKDLFRKMYEFQFNPANEARFIKRDDSGAIIEDRRWHLLESGMASKRIIQIDNMGRKRISKQVDFSPLVFRYSYHRYINGIWVEPAAYDLDGIDFFQTREMASSYLAGMFWVMSYYWVREASVSTRWCYGYTYAPMIQDLMEAIQSMDYQRYNAVVKKGPVAEKPVTPIEHLIAILPESKLKYLPRVVRAAYKSFMPDLYPDRFQVDYNGVQYSEKSGQEIHQAKIIINVPSLDRIHDLYQQFSEDPAVIAALGERRLWTKNIRKF